MKLSETIRRYPHIVNQNVQHEWADHAEALEAVAKTAKRLVVYGPTDDSERTLRLADLSAALEEQEAQDEQ